MKTYIKPETEFVLLDGERYMLGGEVLNKASIHDTDSDKTEVIEIGTGTPGEWGGDAKDGWNGWD